MEAAVLDRAVAITAPVDDRPRYIYALCEPDTGEIRYIGKALDVEQRVRAHLWDGNLAGGTHKAAWLRSLVAQGQEPDVQILDMQPLELIDNAERQWIARYQESGRLTNGTVGGDGGDTFTGLSPDARERALAARRGRVHTSAEKAKRSASQKARLSDPAMRQKWRAVAIRNGSTPPVRRGEANGRARFTDDEVREIRERHAAGANGVSLAEAYDTSPTQISYLVTGHLRADAGGPIRPVRTKQRLSNEDVIEIRRRVAAGETQADVARSFGVEQSHVSNIVRGRSRRVRGVPR